MLDKHAPLGVLLLRLTLGLLFIAHLYWKFALLEGGVSTWWRNLATAGYPWYVPWYAVSAELAGAVFITLGLFTRWACLYALPFMLAAAHFWLARKGFFFTSAGAELPLLWALLLIVQCALGSGPLSLDRLWRARKPALA